MLDGEAQDMGVDPREALLGVAEEGAVEAAQRPAEEGGNAAVRGAAVVEIFVGEVDPRVAEGGAEHRIDPVALQLDSTPEALAILIDAVEPEADRIAERLVEVSGQTEAALAVALRREFAIGAGSSTAWSPG